MKPSKLVVCINDKFNLTLEQSQFIPNRPIKDEMYMIRKRLVTRNGISLLLEEIHNPMLQDRVTRMLFEPSFHIDRFRNVEDPIGDELIEEINAESTILTV